MQVAEKEVDRFLPQGGGLLALGLRPRVLGGPGIAQGEGNRERGEDNKRSLFVFMYCSLVGDRYASKRRFQLMDNMMFQGQEAGGFVMLNLNIM